MDEIIQVKFIDGRTNNKRKWVNETNTNEKKIKLEHIINTKRKRLQIDEKFNFKRIKLEESILPYSIDISTYRNFNHNYNYMMTYIK